MIMRIIYPFRFRCCMTWNGMNNLNVQCLSFLNKVILNAAITSFLMVQMKVDPAIIDILIFSGAFVDMPCIVTAFLGQQWERQKSESKIKEFFVQEILTS